MAGSRELELIFFSLKNRIRILNLGYYIYDEMLTYIAEMCVSVEGCCPLPHCIERKKSASMGEWVERLAVHLGSSRPLRECVNGGRTR